ncbi:hypothetical protein MSPP1_003400 [Malassezia sp. CBS 17886]|nr:hypothetical protein MSPP1_003400 [Malassezia sp. CBS 17886]
MARRKSAFADEGSDSGDSLPQSDAEEHATNAGARRTPSFVPAQNKPASESALRGDDASAHASTDEDADDGAAWTRRTLGRGLGAHSNWAPADARASGSASPPRAGLGARAIGEMPTVASLSRASGSGGFDPMAYMKQMGWTGGGLGREGRGIAAPIEVQLRPNRAGVAFGGRREKTKQERNDERRRTGEPLSDEEVPHTARVAAARVSHAWRKRGRAAKPVVQYRTYDQIVAAVDDGPVLDATGAELHEVDSVAAALARHPVPSSEREQLPELRHNLHLLTQGHSDALAKLAREGIALQDRARWLRRDAEKSELLAHKDAAALDMLRSVVGHVQQLSARAPTAASLAELSADARALAHVADGRALGLDEALAGALVPVLRRTLATWDPLRAPGDFTAELGAWLPLLRGADAAADATPHMTPFESVLWNVWMPVVRHALTNAWDPQDAAPAASLVEAWRGILPPFLYENILDQLVLPKLQRAVQAWSPRSATPLAVMVLPWLPLCGTRLDAVLGDARAQWRSVLSAWRVADGVPGELRRWRDVLPSRDWDALLLDRIVPALAQTLRAMVVDPGAQDMRALEHVLAWRGVLRDSVLSRVMESELAPKWLRVLHDWLRQDDGDLAEIAAWYTFWRSWLPAPVCELHGTAAMFNRALALMNAALDLGAGRAALPPPDTAHVPRASRDALRRPGGAPGGPAPGGPAPMLDEVSFRGIVEEKAGEQDLFVLSQSRLEPTTGLPLFRLAPHIDGKAGVLFYMDDDVLFALRENTFEPVALDELIARARAFAA